MVFKGLFKSLRYSFRRHQLKSTEKGDSTYSLACCLCLFFPWLGGKKAEEEKKAVKKEALSSAANISLVSKQTYTMPQTDELDAENKATRLYVRGPTLLSRVG